MVSLLTLAVLAKPITHGVRHWIFHLGALGFFPLGLLDGSVVPVPGSMDVLTIILSARQRDLWPLYAVTATIGSVIGLYVTYRLARKGGEEALSKRVSPKTLKKIENAFDRWGLGAIAVPAMLPPPVPMVPFVLAAGATQYPVKKFLLALSLGRVVRYSVLGFLAARYGRHILSFFSRFGHPSALTICALTLATFAVIFLFVRLKRHNRLQQSPAQSE